MALEMDLGLEKELNLELIRPPTSNGKGGDDAKFDAELQALPLPPSTSNLRMTVPPTPPPKELPKPDRPTLSPPRIIGLPARPALALDSGAVRPGTSGSQRTVAPLRMNPPTRPGTAQSEAGRSVGLPSVRIVASSRRVSYASVASTRRPIKYGQGKYANVELVPQPSNDPDDPLNWPMWRKELNLGSLLMWVALVGVMKTAFFSVNSQLAQGYEASYAAVAALTGTPLILSAFSGLASMTLSRVWGKRPVYLVSALLIFIGAVWDSNVAFSFSQCMAARVFQGLGWGAFDTLVLGSIHDTYFEHERSWPIVVYNIVAVATTWGPPLLGGVASQGQTGFSLQFAIIGCFFIVAVPLIVLGAPETAFDRGFSLAAQTPATATGLIGGSTLPPFNYREMFTVEWAKGYVAKMKPLSFSGPRDMTILLQAPRACLAPTTLLLFVVSVLPACAMWGLATSLSLLFAPLPFLLSPSSLGALFTAPFIMATATVAAFSILPRWQMRFVPKSNLYAIAAGTTLVFAGVLTFGLHLAASMTPPAMPTPSVTASDPSGSGIIDGATDSTSPAIAAAPVAPSIFTLGFLGQNVSFPATSFLLGLLVTGIAVLDATAAPLIRRSTQFTSSNLGVALRNTSDMHGGAGVWRSLAIGMAVIAFPGGVWDWAAADLRSTCIGLVVAQCIIALVVAGVWWRWDEAIRRCDGRMMRCVDLEMLKRTGSFFDLD